MGASVRDIRAALPAWTTIVPVEPMIPAPVEAVIHWLPAVIRVAAKDPVPVPATRVESAGITGFPS